MKPLTSAISSRQEIRTPCRCSRTWTNSPASSSESWVPVSSQANPRPRFDQGGLAGLQVDVVQVGDLQLAAGAGLQVGGVPDTSLS